MRTWGMRREIGSEAGWLRGHGLLGMVLGLMYLQLWTFLRIPSDLPFLRIRRNKIFYARAPDLGQLTCMDMGTMARLTASHHPVGPEKVLGNGKKFKF